MTWAIGVVAVIAFFVWVVRAVYRSDMRQYAEAALWDAIEEETTSRVRAVLISRGHYLRKDTRDAANVWLLERENKQ